MFNSVARAAAARLAPARAGPLGELQLGRRWLYVLPTREGLYYGAMLAVMLLAAMNYANGLAYALAFLLSALAVVGVLHTHRNVSGLRLAPGPAPPVFVGQPAVFTVVLHNDAGAARRAVELSSGGQTRRVDVPAGGNATVDIAAQTMRRGYLPAPTLRVRTRFPLGLWHVWSRPLMLPGRCLVYPRPAGARPLPASPGAPTGGDVDHSTESEDFAGLREYRPGDPMQRVAWKKAAGGQGWHTKQFSAAGGRVVWLDWHALHGLDTEERLSVLCHWVLTAEQHGIAYGLRLPGTVLAPASGPDHRAHSLERLALFEAPA